MEVSVCTAGVKLAKMSSFQNKTCKAQVFKVPDKPEILETLY